MRNEKKILFIDMDGVLVNLEESIIDYKSKHHYNEQYQKHPDTIPGIFRNPPPIEGAIEAVKKLEESGKYDMYIATAAPWNNPDSSTDKRFWIEKHFKKLFKRKLIISHNKNLLMGDYLIDDRTANGAGEFKGELLGFGINYENGKINEYPDWEAILEKLL